MSCEMFNASVYVSEELNRQLVNMSQDLVHRCIRACAEHYNFDASEAVRLLGISMLKVERKAKVKSDKIAKVSVPKSAFPLPYNGEFNESCCYALRQNNGLYTQCTGVRKGEAQFCKGCATSMQKTGAEVPEYGTIQQRMAVDIFEYIDPKGRKPISYTKVMKKYKISQEQVLEEAGKFNIIVNSNHFVAPETDSIKRGRPKTEKEPKAKGVKGRPKKEKKVLMVEGEEEEDLFAALVANSLEETEVMSTPNSEVVSTPKKPTKSDEEREAERLAKEQAKLAEKESKRLAAEAAKKEKEDKLAAEKAEKELKKEAERIAREEKKKAEEQAKLEEKLAKKEAAEKAKAEKLAAKEKKRQDQSSKPAPVVNAPVVEDEEEPDVVKKVEFEGKKYLKSKKSGIIYDYNEYVKNGEQVVVGKWNDNTNKIEFSAPAEEEEEEEEEYVEE